MWVGPDTRIAPRARRRRRRTAVPHATRIHPLPNGNRCALIEFRAAIAGGVLNAHELGVCRTGRRWALFDQDFAALTDDVAVTGSSVRPRPNPATACSRMVSTECGYGRPGKLST